MPVIAYLANQFPSPVEPYVVEEVCDLRRRGISIVTVSGQQVDTSNFDHQFAQMYASTIVLAKFRLTLILAALWLLIRRHHDIRDLLFRLLTGPETLGKRIRAMAHTFLGACCAVHLRPLGVDHIHVHHGYFAAWIAMVAARLLRISFSMTLHGSDLLVHGCYLNMKLAHCSRCFTVSEYNRRFIAAHYPDIDCLKVVLQRTGVNCAVPCAPVAARPSEPFRLLAVGRLHLVKNFEFLIRCCHSLQQQSFPFHCRIVGEGPERRRLENLCAQLHLEKHITLLGHIPREKLADYYSTTDLVVCSSRSEGIPLTLMEAMVRGLIVLAPRITGIPELVIDGQTGFLYQPDSAQDFLAQLRDIQRSWDQLASIRHAARAHVMAHFNRDSNLEEICVRLLSCVHRNQGRISHANPVLQQI